MCAALPSAYGQSPRLDAARIRAGLDADPVRIATLLLGEPNKKLSRPRDMRWGNKGSLSLAGAVFYDHSAGVGGDLLSLIQYAKNIDFPTALAVGSDMLGGGYEELPPPRREPIARVDHRAMALDLWRETLPARGSPVERYLIEHRGVSLPDECQDIRWHPACPRHWRPEPIRAWERLPAMVAAMRDIVTDEIVCLHRTYLLPDGSGRADVSPSKMMLGSPGRPPQSAIKIFGHADVTTGLGIGEGIETTLKLLRFGVSPVWALGTRVGIEAFPVLNGIEHLTIAVDNDLSGDGDISSRICAERWAAAGCDVTLVRPRRLGKDIADLDIPE